MTDLFPYSSVRKNQDQLVAAVAHAVEKKQGILMNAPTGLGKTAGALAPALAYALKNKLTVFFLTSRHTQHRIAVDTLKEIQEKHGVSFTVADIIGRRGMCLQPGVERFYGNDFNEFCKNLREEYTCEYYVATREKTGKPKLAAEQLAEQKRVLHVNEMVDACSSAGLCPYEVALLSAKQADVIIADYYHIFNPHVRDSFLHKIEKELSKSIIIVDEGHNLPARIRTLLSYTLSDVTIKKAAKEVKQFDDEAAFALRQLQGLFEQYAHEIPAAGESLFPKKSFVDDVSNITEYDPLVDNLGVIGDQVRVQKKQSFAAMVSEFLQVWKGEDEGYVRILSRNDKRVQLAYTCLDPSLVSSAVIKEAHSTIMMSGTLHPTQMYRDLLGFPAAEEYDFENPFPKHNRLSVVVPTVTTKFSHRSEQQYAKIAETCGEILKRVPGNAAVFFPSYSMMEKVDAYWDADKKQLFEKPGMSTEEKAKLLETFKHHKKEGAVLMAVTGASFSEGIDLPGDFLKCVIVVGLPLTPPDIETQELIRYYDHKFDRGWEYGYVLPALTKTIQTAGRCIRSETDKGAIFFLDYRYALPQYKRVFPADWDVEVTDEFEDLLTEFWPDNG